MKSCRWIALGALLVLGLAGCGANPQPSNGPASATLGEEFQVQAGKTAVVSPDSIQVTFARVIEDSRCPTDVQCVWAGQAIVQIQVSPSGGGPGTADLTLGGSPQGASSATFGAYKVEIRDLDPSPVSTSSTRPEDYVVTLIVSK